MKKEELENLSAYNQEELDSYKYWKWDTHFILVNPRNVVKIAKNEHIYGLDTRDGSDFLIEGEQLQEYRNDRGDFLLAIEK